MSERDIQLKEIKMINEILQEKGKTLSPEDFDVLIDLPSDELERVRFRIEETMQTSVHSSS